LMKDLQDLMPHAKKEVKYDSKSLYELNEVADAKNCNNIVFFECRRKRPDLYLWVGRTPNGPTIKFQVTNVHTMSELKFSGNCLKGSRPLLFFDEAFNEQPHTRLFKELFSQAFGTPYMHPKSKPFIDHVLCFYLSPDGHIWFRNYQITESYMKERVSRNKEEQVLVEIGPRFVLNPIKILSGSFCGAPIYENPSYVAPSVMRAVENSRKAKKYVERVVAQQQTAKRKEENKLEPDVMDTLFTDDLKDDEDSEERDQDGEYEPTGGDESTDNDEDIDTDGSNVSEVAHPQDETMDSEQ